MPWIKHLRTEEGIMLVHCPLGKEKDRCCMIGTFCFMVHRVSHYSIEQSYQE